MPNIMGEVTPMEMNAKAVRGALRLLRKAKRNAPQAFKDHAEFQQALDKCEEAIQYEKAFNAL